MEYYEHPNYGHENLEDKVITVTLKTPLTRAQVDALFDDAPQLDSKFDDLSYTDGEKMRDGFDHAWEKTDITPRGLLDYKVEQDKITIRASEAITPAYFFDAVRYVLSETARVENLPIKYVGAFGVTLSYSGDTLQDVANTLDTANRRKPAPPKRGMQP